jgi:hypothetical protein
MDFCQTVVFFKEYDSDYKQARRNKTRTYLNKVKVAIPNIFIKISLKNFQQEMRKIFKIFPTSFDQKSQKNVI